MVQNTSKNQESTGSKGKFSQETSDDEEYTSYPDGTESTSEAETITAQAEPQQKENSQRAA